MNTNMTNHALRALARGSIVLAASLGAVALAQPLGQIDVSGRGASRAVTQSTEVYIGDLNLAEMGGQQRLHHRIRIAAKQVCDNDSLWSAKAQADYRRCFNQAVNSAQAEAMQRFAAGDRSSLRVAAS